MEWKPHINGSKNKSVCKVNFDLNISLYKNYLVLVPVHKIRRLTFDDVERVADIHLFAFEDFFLSSLGKRFLLVYYKACIEDTQSISIGILDSTGNVVGFAVGCVQSLGFHKRILLNNLFPFIQQGLKILCTRPKALMRLMKNFEKTKKKSDDGNYSELLSIAISPKCKGLGLGKSLLQEFENQARIRGCNVVTLTTDFYENNDVSIFYQKNGYKVFYDFIAFPQRKMYKLFKVLN